MDPLERDALVIRPLSATASPCAGPAQRSSVFAAFALSLPEGQLGDFFLDLPTRQTDIVDQMRIGLRDSLEFPAKVVRSRQAAIMLRRLARLRRDARPTGTARRAAQ